MFGLLVVVVASFTVLVHPCYEVFDFPALPVVHPSPVLRDVVPYENWPIWNPQDEASLRWTDLEKTMFADTRFGNTNRLVDMSQPLPTALHSWGSPLEACPCGCRSQGFSLQTLLTRGLRGIEFRSGAYPYESRHVHPRELQLLLGFPPLQQVLPGCKAQLCLYGNSVSPIQVLWVLLHLHKHVGFSSGPEDPTSKLSQFLGILLQQRDVTWPSPSAGIANLVLKWPNYEETIRFDTTQTIGDLIQAEEILSNLQGTLCISCDGIQLASWAFLQERTYEVKWTEESDRYHIRGPVFIWYLGVEQWAWVPKSFTNALLLKWQGILDFQMITDEHHQRLDLFAKVKIGGTVVVHLDIDTVALDLDLGMIGFGSDSCRTGGLRFSETFPSAGLWQFDQWVRSNCLISWAGTGYEPLTVWLPSLAEALVEFWPGTIDDQLREWTTVPNARVYAIVWEFWGWNLVKFILSPETFQVTFFEPSGAVSGTVARLATRLQQLSNRPQTIESFVEWKAESSKGSLSGVFSVLDQDLGLPSFVVQALSQVRPSWPADVSEDSHSSCSTTLPWTFAHQCPVPLKHSSVTLGGLSARFILDFTRALVQQEPLSITQEQVKVLHITSTASCRIFEDTIPFEAAQGPLYLFVLVDRHWTFVHAFLEGSVLHFRHFDGLACTELSRLAPLLAQLKQAWNPQSVVATSSWIFPQRSSHTCGSLALAHFAYQLGLITFGQGFDFEEMHDSLAVVSGLLRNGGPIGFGNDEKAVRETLEQILPGKGVPSEELQARIQSAVKTFGTAALSKALGEKQVWPALKQLGSSRPKPFFWVTHHELQMHIRDRGQAKFGANLDMKKSRQNKSTKRSPAVANNIDPETLQLMSGLFSTNDGSPLSQLSMSQVQKDARGVAFTTPGEALPFLSDGKMISGEGLALLIVGALPSDVQTAVPLHAMRIPAIYKPTNEPIIGDEAVYQCHSPQAPTIDVYPTAVLRLHIFHDLWTEKHSWEDLVARPIKSLVACFDALRLCREEGCDGSSGCGLYHPSLEEEGIESGLVDVWGFRWATYEGGKAQPEKAQVLSVYIRVPESSFAGLHGLSGLDGVFFEPRSSDTPGPDPAYAVVWGPQLSLQDGFHKTKTQDICLAVCRLGHKIGLRCLKKHQEELHKELCPHKPFVNCGVTGTYRVEPLPAGTQRQSLLDLLSTAGWIAKPLRAVKGAQGKAWHVGSDQDPPKPFIEARHGWVSISKVKDFGPPAKPTEVIAPVKTRQHIQTHGSSAASSSTADPWTQGQDPWGSYTKTTKPAAVVPSTHVQQKLDDVETRLSSQVQATLAKELTDFKEQHHAQKSDRLSELESKMQAIATHQASVDQQVAAVQHECGVIQDSLQHCQQHVEQQGAVLQNVVQEVGTCQKSITQQSQTLASVVHEVAGVRAGLQNQTSQLELYFQKQTEQIEAMLAKRHKTE